MRGMQLPRWLLAGLRLPTYGLNGISVSLGLALVQLLVWPIGGASAAFVAASGAIYASLADTPLAPDRTRYRVFTAALVGTCCSALVLAVAAHPVLLALTIALIAAASCMALAWGPRAGAVSFVGILALVFSLALPPGMGLPALAQHTGWTLLGALLYLAWASLASRLLQPRLRKLALAGTLETLAALLQSRSRLLRPAEPGALPAQSPLQEWLAHQAVLDERLQAARDLLFPALDRPGALAQTQALLQVIELRDTLLVSELDLESLDLGPQAAARATALRETLCGTMEQIATQLARIALALQFGEPVITTPGTVADLRSQLQAQQKAALDDGVSPAQQQLVNALVMRGEHMLNDLARLQAALAAPQPNQPPLPMPDREELLRFVSAEGWPLAALKSQWHLASPVLRHALRCAVALTSAYVLALWLPWASHPHWLVLSVAVVLRGNLEQTLARRDARMAGTLIGCLVVMLLAALHVTALSGLLFLLAAGVAHAFVNRRYLVTAIAAAVMALLQAHLAQPEAGFGVAERLADTVLGALLAWGFSFVLPWWEHRSLALQTGRLRLGLTRLAEQVLRWPLPAQPELPLKLARREVYDSIGALAGMAQRTGVEPRAVRLPIHTLATLLVQCHVLLAQLAALRRLLIYRHPQMNQAATEAALARCATHLAPLLTATAGLLPGEPQRKTSSIAAPTGQLPSPTGSDGDSESAHLMRWLQRRLDLIELAAQRLTAAAEVLKAAAMPPVPAKSAMPGP